MDSKALPTTSSTLQANSATTVLVGMSGGVDSSVTAALLKEQGYRVIGMFMKNWDEKDESGACTTEQDFSDVEKVCSQLDIPYTGIEFVKEYWDNVFTEFLRDYKAGFTPNPDILCNREIKFNVFLKKAREMGADVLATGHYCQTVKDFSHDAKGESILLKGKDAGKDQSYFVYTLKREILDQVMFPIGGLEKKEVRRLAAKWELATSEKKDSTGICFIGERNFREFLSKYVAAKPGSFRTLDGKVVGRHRGVAYYTLGQRKGLGLGGEGEAWFVVAKDVGSNTVFVERGEFHPGLYADDLEATELSFVSGFTPELPLRARAKVRYRQADQACTVEQAADGKLKVRFDEPQRAITPRQSVVFYTDYVDASGVTYERCLGGAIIDSVGPSYFEQGKSLPLKFTSQKQKDFDQIALEDRTLHSVPDVLLQ